MSGPPRRPRGVATEPLKLLGSPPKDPLKDTYLWADYIELRCLVAPDRRVTRGDLVGMLRLDPEEAPLADSADDDVAQMSDGETDNRPEGTVPASRATDNRYRLAEDIFDLLESRFLFYDEAYPFEIDLVGITRQMELTALQQTYVFLLLCSLGRYVEQHGLLTKSFERLSAKVLETSLPTANVKVFGTAKSGLGYQGNFVERARQLAKELGEQMQPGADAIASSEQGDRGLDVVANFDPGDTLSGRLVIFAQAATGRDWHTKQQSVQSSAWDPIIQVRAPAVATCLISLCFRDPAGGWFDPTLIARTWLLDRKRILHQVASLDGSTSSGWEDAKSTEIVQRLLNWTYDE